VEAGGSLYRRPHRLSLRKSLSISKFFAGEIQSKPELEVCFSCKEITNGRRKTNAY